MTMVVARSIAAAVLTTATSVEIAEVRARAQQLGAAKWRAYAYGPVGCC